MSSSPLRPGASPEEELDYYKKQYEQLETDLAEFQASSKELEDQLERDVENAEKSERKQKEQVEALTFQVEEWRTKHNKAKAEANSAQNALQKEITTLREASRTMQLRLRDIEVVNDDYERQARNTVSSLEDMESKYNIAIERGVLLDEEIKTADQERERLRIETQRLRDELGDLKVENEITLEKLRLADGTIERLRSRKPSPLAVENLRARSPGSETSGITPYSPTASTPPPKSDTASEAATPPSPPLSDAPGHGTKTEPKTPVAARRRSLIPDVGKTPRAGPNVPRPPSHHSHRPSVASHAGVNASEANGMRPPAFRPRASRPSTGPSEGLARSDSLYQIRNLRGRMQKIEERVHSARSKLPAPQNRTPKGSPRPGSGLGGEASIPSSVTVRRSTMRRPPASVTSQSEATTSDGAASDAAATRRGSHVKRLSYGIPRASSSMADQRPASAMDRPPSATAVGRPESSRTSLSSRPGSRTSGTHTPLGHYANGTVASSIARPRSSIGGAGGGGGHSTIPSNTPLRSHRTSASVGELKRAASAADDHAPPVPSTPSRRSITASRRPSAGVGGISLPSSSSTSSAATAASFLPGPKSSAQEDGQMLPPPPTLRRKRPLRIDEKTDDGDGGLGETY